VLAGKRVGRKVQEKEKEKSKRIGGRKRENIAREKIGI
jgi:hypothetical protein